MFTMNNEKKHTDYSNGRMGEATAYGSPRGYELILVDAIEKKPKRLRTDPHTNRKSSIYFPPIFQT
jgi:hypothetical protein